MGQTGATQELVDLLVATLSGRFSFVGKRLGAVGISCEPPEVVALLAVLTERVVEQRRVGLPGDDGPCDLGRDHA